MKEYICMDCCMSLFLRPAGIRSASPAYHMLRSLPLIPFKPKTCWAESLQGARSSNEDEFNVFPVKNKVGFFCVHDGHAGITTGNMLQELMTVKWAKFRLGFCPGDETACAMENDANVLWLADAYKDAVRRLKAQPSGAVSISALVVENQAIYFAWIGDCEGCVFVNDHELVDPIYKNADNVIEVVDFADVNVHAAKAPNAAPCATYPHSLLGRVRFRLNSDDDNNDNDGGEGECEAKKPIKESIPKFSSMETLKYYFNVEPICFGDKLSHKEYQRVKRWFPEAVKGLDVGIQRVGAAEIFLDVRISKSTQPTRTLGDSHNNNSLPILRDPTVMKITLSPETPQLNILLCSDGAFSERAFANTKAVCRFLVNPVAFFRESFYARGQILTERLIAVRLLPENLSEDRNSIDFVCLYKRWKACRTWDDILIFLREHHYLCISSKILKAVISSDDILAYVHWLKMCKEAIRWLEFNSREDHLTLPVAVKLAARMAIIMGSTDNVTIVAAQAY